MAKIPLKYQLINPLKIKTDCSGLDFSVARDIADRKVSTLSGNSSLVSWFNATTGESYPDEKRRKGGKPEWLSHAERCKCDMTVDINDEQFVFVYRTKA